MPTLNFTAKWFWQQLANHISVNDVFYYLQESMKHSYTKYSIDTNTFKSDILSNRASMNYVLDEDKFGLGEYFYVSHILVKFTDAQKRSTHRPWQRTQSWRRLQMLLTQKRREKSLTQQKLNSMAKQTQMTVSELYDRIQNDIEGKLRAKNGNLSETICLIMQRRWRKQKRRIWIYCRHWRQPNGKKFHKRCKRTFMTKAMETSRYSWIMTSISASTKHVEWIRNPHLVLCRCRWKNVFEINENNFESFSLTNATGETLEANIERIQTFNSPNSTQNNLDLVYEKLVSDDIAYLQTLNLNALKDDAKLNPIQKTFSSKLY